MEESIVAYSNISERYLNITCITVTAACDVTVVEPISGSLMEIEAF